MRDGFKAPDGAIGNSPLLLEHFNKSCIHMRQPTRASWGVTLARAWPMAVIKSAGVRASAPRRQTFDFAPHLFNGIEIRRVGWQEKHLRFPRS